MALASLLVKASERTKRVVIPKVGSLVSQLVLGATTENTFTPHRFSDPMSQCISAMLVVFAATEDIGGAAGWWEQALAVVAALMLPILALHSSAYTAFQCLNALGIYRALNSGSSSDVWRTTACVLMHLFLVLANLDLRSQQQLNSVMQKVT
ncbi:hypothetical protein GGI00_006350, partial [Coemansia sp. RSA 2681]